MGTSFSPQTLTLHNAHIPQFSVLNSTETIIRGSYGMKSLQTLQPPLSLNLKEFLSVPGSKCFSVQTSEFFNGNWKSRNHVDRRKKVRYQGGDRSVCKARAGSDMEAHLCLFPLMSACLPTATGQLLVREPRYLQMFEVIMEVARAELNTARFGMLSNVDSLNDIKDFERQPDDARIGCCCHVEGISDRVGEGLLVNYKCVRRFMIKSVKIVKPFRVSQVDWITDFPSDLLGTTSSGALRDRLEREVWQALNEVAALTAELASGNQEGDALKRKLLPQDLLPAEVRQFAPLPSWTFPNAAPNRHVATDIAIWRRSSSSGARSGSIASVERSTEKDANPYWSAREKLVKPLRQETFSFAAATIVEAGAEERSALLQTRDTSARLSWVLAAVQPYLNKLRAQKSLLNLMGHM